MPLDIGFPLPDGTYDWRMQLEDDGCYWFLHAWFTRVQQTTGRYIDLYGHTEFHEANGLGALIDAMDEAKSAAGRQPKEWKVHTGTQLRPVRKELYDTVQRTELVQTIGRFLALLHEAKVDRRTIVFQGD